MQHKMTGVMRASQQTAQANQQSAQAAGQAAQGFRDEAQAAQEATAANQHNTQAQQQDTAAAQANTQAQQANAQSLRDKAKAEREAEREAKKHADAIRANTKQLLFMAIGAASVFRLVQKLKQGFTETVETLTRNTAAAERLQRAQDALKVSFAGVIGDSQRWQEILNDIAVRMERFAQQVTLAAATVKGFAAVAAEGFSVVATSIGQMVNALKEGDPVAAIKALEQGAPGILRPLSFAQTFIDAYNASLEQSARAQEEYTIAIEKGKNSVNGQKDRLKDLAEAQKDLDKLQQQLADAEKRRLEELADLERERVRRLQDINEELQRDLQDLALKGSRKREDIEIAYRRKIEDINRRQAEQQTQIEEKLRLKLLQIEMRYREQMIRIQENFDDAMYSAIMKRDATAALLAIRQKRRDEGRAQRERSDAITLANAEAQIQRNQQQRSLEQMREDARLARERALEDLRIDLARERADIQTNYDREMEDLAIWHQRRLADIEADYQARLARSRAQYKQEETEYAQHLERQEQQLASHIQRMNAQWSKLQLMPKQTTSNVYGQTYGNTPYPYGSGGDQVFSRPTNIRVAEGGRPERVTVQPLTSGSGGGTFSGTMRHQIDGTISAAMDGFAGRLTPMITGVVLDVMGEMLN